MKLRGWIIGITVIVILCYTGTLHYIKQQSIPKLNIVQMNDIVKAIEEGKAEDTLAKQYEQEFQVVYRESQEYDRKIYRAISERATIIDLEKEGEIIGKVVFPLETAGEEELQSHLIRMSSLLFGVVILFVWLMGALIYYRFLHPFQELEQFASNVAAGNFDFSLHMRKKNYFGAFTESFDLMREELENARRGEYAANQSKKELVASLSHDIKTPVSTIKAYCEILSLKSKEKDTLDKIQIIDTKADMIDHLISDMFHATLEELSVLKIEPKEELSTVIGEMFEDVNYYAKIQFQSPVPECLIYCDALRLGQVIDNVINNSYKYAGTRIVVTPVLEEDSLKITIRDFGQGVKEGELALVCSKFYRGSNGASKNGSGLGLYLANQFMDGMGGSLEVFNENGFVVVLHIPVAGKHVMK